MPKSNQEINADAVETLFNYRLPIVRDVLGHLPEPRIPNFGTLDLARLRRETGEALNGVHSKARIKIEDLTAELDRLQVSGKQHLLLLWFSGNPEELEALTAAEQIKNRLSERGLADRFNRAPYIDVNDVDNDPVLAEVRYEPGRQLTCKWVERRTWEELVKTGPDTFLAVTREARAVNFFDLNLLVGTAEVKIQKLRSTALHTREKKLEEYLLLGSETLGIQGFKPLPLSRAIRHLLSDRDVEMTRVKVVLEAGGTWEGKPGDVCPEPPEQVRAAVLLESKWRAPDGRRIRVGLDARINELQILNACSPEQYRAIVNEARVWSDGPREPTQPEPTPPGPTPPPPGPTPPEPLPEPRNGKPETLWRRLRRIVDESKLTETQEFPETSETTKLVKEYVAVENEKVAAGLGDSKLERGQTAWTSQTAIETFLRHTKKVLAEEISFYDQQLETLAPDERLVFRLSIGAIAIGLAFLVVGFVLAGTGLLTVGIVSGIVGILSGSVWVLIRQLANQLEKRRTAVEEKIAERRNLMRAIESSLLIGTWDAMKDVAEKLWQFAVAPLPKS